MVKRNPVVGKTYEWLGTKDKILEKMPQLSSAHIDGWEAYWVTDGGWVAAKDTIDSIGQELERLGVKHVFGPWVFSERRPPYAATTDRALLAPSRSGTFQNPLLSADGKTCVGAEAVDGTVHKAERVVLACGAWTPTLVDLQGQCISKVSSGLKPDLYQSA